MPSFVYLTTALIGLGGALFGYDIGIISGVLAFDSFKLAFDIDDWSNHLEEKGLIVSSFVIGNMLGALSASGLADSLGRKRTLVTATFCFLAASSIQVLASTLITLYIGRLLSGWAIGMLSSVVPLYNSELAPAAIRGRLISFNQISMTGGILVSFWVGYLLRNVNNGWRYALAGQMIPALIILIGSPFLPRSPRWLIKIGRYEEAKTNLYRLRAIPLHTSTDVVHDEYIEMMQTIQQEQSIQTDTWRYLFSNALSRKRLLICMFLQTGQQLTGINVIMYYMPFVAQSIGFGGQDHGLLAQGINGIVNFLSTFVAFFLVDRMGRRIALIAGGLFMAIAMGTLGCLGMTYAVISSDSKSVTVENKYAGWMCVVSIYLYVFGFAWSWGPVCWLYPTEVLPTSQRAKGVSLTTASNFMFNFLIAQFSPMLRDRLNFKLFVLFAGSCFGMVIFVYFFIPESRGRSLEELGNAFGTSDVAANDDKNESLLRQEIGNEQQRLNTGMSSAVR